MAKMTDELMELVDGVVYGQDFAPFRGWHDDHLHTEGTLDYMPCMQQCRSEFEGLLDVIINHKLAGSRCLQLGLGVCGASHAAWRQIFGYVCTVDMSPPTQRLLRMSQLFRDQFVVGRTQDVADQLDDASYNFLFIDAGHSYQEVRSDYELYARKVRKGGIIAFHDALPRARYPEIGVSFFLREIETTMIGTDVGTAWMVKR